MKLTCQVCGAAIATEDIDLENKVVRCGGCRAVFDLGGRKGPALGATGFEPRPALRVPIPQKFKVEEEPGLLRISWSWFSPWILILAFVCVAWDSFLLLWFVLIFTKEKTPSSMMMIPILHVAVGVGLTYRTITGFVNRTMIEATRSSLTIQHGPMPWSGNHTFQAQQIKQLFCEQASQRSTGSSRNFTYQLNAIQQDGRKLTLLGGLLEAGQALYLEEQLEKLFGITDQPVPGELNKGQRSA